MCSQWGKLRPGDSKRGSKIADLADELMARRGSGRGSELKPYDYAPNVLYFFVAHSTWFFAAETMQVCVFACSNYCF